MYQDTSRRYKSGYILRKNSPTDWLRSRSPSMVSQLMMRRLMEKIELGRRLAIGDVQFV